MTQQMGSDLSPNQKYAVPGGHAWHRRVDHHHIGDRGQFERDDVATLPPAGCGLLLYNSSSFNTPAGLYDGARLNFAHLEFRTVPNPLQGIPTVVLLLAATVLEVSGDAVVRIAIYNHVGLARLGLFLAGAVLLSGYGTLLNLAPLEFGQVVGLYLATLFVVWQVINFVAFRALPTLPIVIGGSLVIAGGAIITFWKPA